MLCELAMMMRWLKGVGHLAISTPHINGNSTALRDDVTWSN
jgi:hypothetical protein